MSGHYLFTKNLRSMECQVCVEPYSKKRTKVHCNCGLDVCIVCAKRYILDRAELPHCMSCKNRLTKQFLYDKKSIIYILQRPDYPLLITTPLNHGHGMS